MTTDTTATVARASWLAALDALRVKEKAMTAQLDALAAERHRLPRERVEGEYEFDTTEGHLGQKTELSTGLISRPLQKGSFCPSITAYWQMLIYY